MRFRLSLLFLIFAGHICAQTQTCPVNINFATGDLTHWFAYTGNNGAGRNNLAQMASYDSAKGSPNGTRGVKSITEFQLSSVKGIQVITTQSTDVFGDFPKIPTINGYNYGYSILLGSTSITRGNGDGSGGGYVRGVSYSISVPAGPSTEPYTMTYAYAMVLENGTHASSQQPFISATLQTPAGIIECASPSYYLPTLGNVSEGGRGATLDSAAAKRNGFKVSSLRSPNLAPGNNNGAGGGYLQDVWTKPWTEVTFDLSAYRGQKVSLTFEAQNCIPGGHFAYGYIAIRNNCAGLMISGDSLVCNNSVTTFSVPSLAGATYDWEIPSSWSLISSDTGNIIQVKSSNDGGRISVREKNSCADLTDTVEIKTLPSPEAGNLSGNAEVCSGENHTPLQLENYTGQILNWLVSTDSVSYIPVANLSDTYNAENLVATSYYKVVVEKGTVCPPDTSSVAVVAVDEKSLGGDVSPRESILCAGQTAGQLLILTKNRGSIINWQFATDNLNWVDQDPANANDSNRVSGITVNTQYRAIVKNGVCPSDTTTPVNIIFNPARYPEATITPADTTICYGTAAVLNSLVNIGTRYEWLPGLTGDGNVETGRNISKNVSPQSSTVYILKVFNDGCPNPLLDTFQVQVLAPVVVNAGNDTSVVAGQPLQFHATTSDPGPDDFLWTPATDLTNVFISDPVGNYSFLDNTITYTIKVTTPAGCTGTDSLNVRIFKTRPDIFVPNAFTPGTAQNALFRPIPVGITTLDYFRVYNRIGQMVYNTSVIGNGWDGLLNGVPQGSGGYVWVVRGTDYTGHVIEKKGTMVLVR